MQYLYHDEAAETLSRDKLAALQNERLKKIVRHVMADNAWFRARFEAAGIDPEGFRGLEDLTKLPFMSKKDFR